MENNTTSRPQASYSTRTLIILALLALLGILGIWYFNKSGEAYDLKFAVASEHSFVEPDVFFGGKGLRYEIVANDPRMLKVYVPVKELDAPKYLLVEDGELDFLGFVKKDQLYIPLQLFQIHNDRPGPQQSPVTDCKTYIEVASVADTIIVLVDKKHVLRGTRVGTNLYVIPFCENTREHEFETLGLQGAKGSAPVAYSTLGIGGMGRASKQLRYSGDTVRMYSYAGGVAPVAHNFQSPNPVETTRERQDVGLTKVTLTLPRRLSSPWVFANDKRLSDFKLNAARNQITFQVRTSDKLLNVRAGDSNCECQASGYPRHSTLELSGFCECRDVQVHVTLDPGLDRYRNRIKVYMDGYLTDIQVPSAGQPLVFSVRKAGRDQYVEIKLVMPDDAGNVGLFDICSFFVPAEATTSVLTPDCYRKDLPANLKVSGK